MKSKLYIFGDPKIREKVHEDEIREGLRFAAHCIDRAMAILGFCAVAMTALMICAF